MTTLLQGELDGKRIAYHSGTKFEIQLGKGKSAYKTVQSFEGNLYQAALTYTGYNVHSGYKKRLIAHSMNKPVLARYISQ